jgi:hypothetical protein
LFRVSTFLYPENIDVDLAVNLGLGRFSVDGEVFAQVVRPEEQSKASGYLAGIAFAINDRVEIAFRNDGVSPDLFKEMEQRIGAGFSFLFFEDVFFAMVNQQARGQTLNLSTICSPLVNI